MRKQSVIDMVNEHHRPPSLLLGFGNVGKELVLLDDFWNMTEVLGILSSSGGVKTNGKERVEAIREAAKTSAKLSDLPFFQKGLSLSDFIDELSGGVAFITIPPSYYSGEPNISLVLNFLKNGISIITADKTPFALAYSKVIEASRSSKAFIGYRATVAAGTPFTDLAKGLRGRSITSIKSVLNATTNFLLSKVEEGKSWEESLELARKEKLLEPDPRIDVEGIDSAAKLTIISNTLGKGISLWDVRRTPLFSINEEMVRRALKEGKRYKYIASYSFDGGNPTVSPQLIQNGNPLYDVRGNYNGILFELEGSEHIYLEGPAGPAWRTARVMITDLIEMLYSPR